MTRRIRAVVFDLDGTLLDTLADIARAMNSVLSRHALPSHEVDAYRWMVGSGLEALVRRAVPWEVEADAMLVGKLATELRREYESDPVAKTRPYDGVPQLLDSLAERRVPVAILSNKADALVRRIVDELLGDHRFRVVQGLRDDVPAKPDPTSALAIASALGCAPAGVLYLGDSDVDMQTAANAKMIPVGAGWGFRGAEELRAAGAAVVLDHPGELLHLIDEGVTDGITE
jgi:phosphoglycolate phosphatase